MEQNGKDFYKYYDPKTAIEHVLGRGTIKWSTPFEFNDPFDNQFELHLEEVNDQLIDNLNRKFYTRIPEMLDLTPFVLRDENNISIPSSVLKQAASKLEIGDEEKAIFREGIVESIQKLQKDFPELREVLLSQMRDTSIFCVSEVYDDILMWSHYADKHKGVAFKFLPLKEVDSPLQLAKPVNYSNDVPKINYDAFISALPKDVDMQVRKFISLFTLTKSKHWEYEKEWRVISRLRNKSELYEILPFDFKEIGAVYLGCKITSQNEEQVLDLMKAKCPKAEIYKAQKSQTKFALEFEKIS